MRNPLFRFLLLFLGVFFTANAQGQVWKTQVSNSVGNNYSLHKYTINDGLPAKNATSVIKDKNGFIWVGTENGLCRFDGYNFTVYQRKTGDTTSISNNIINALATDKNGNIWVGTMDGLNLFDPVSARFKRYYHHTKNPASLSNNIVWSVLVDRKNTVWIGTDDGFNRFDKGSNSFHVYKPETSVTGRMQGKSINAITEDGRYLWLGNWSAGLNKFDTTTGRFTNYQQTHKPGEKNPNDVWALCKDKNGDIWVGTYWTGLFKFNPDDEKFTAYSQPDAGNKAIFTLALSGKNMLVAGGNENYYQLNTVTKQWKRLADIENFPHSDILSDTTGITWIAAKNGLAKLDFKQIKFNFLSGRTMGNDVRSIVVKDSVIWAGTYKGLIKCDFKNNRTTIYKHTSDKRSLGNNQISKLYLDKSNRLWITTEFGFDLFDEKTGSFKHHTHHSQLSGFYNEDVFRDIVEIAPGKYALATDAGLKIYDDGSGRFEHYFTKEGTNTISNNHLNCLVVDAARNVWIGTAGGGLNYFNTKTKRFTAYLANDGRSRSISNNTIQRLFIDKKGTLWVSTPDGLNRYNKSTDSFTLYSKANGFPNNVFYSMVQDDAGYLWILTERGLSRLNTSTGKVRNFDESDGVLANSAIYKTAEGIYLAGSSGLGFFNPAQLHYNSKPPAVFLTDLQVFNKPLEISPEGPLFTGINLTKEIRLDYKQNVFSIGFVALNYSLPEKNEYAYKLEGFANRWTHVRDIRRATYTNLSPGRYVFKVIASNNDGVWNTIGKSIVIIITPPWYQTWWAYLLYILATGSLVYLYILYRERQSKLKYEIQLAHLESEKEKELSERKLSFFTNISHEFRTPLTLIINPVKELLYKEAELDASSLNIVYRNAKRLLSLVDQLLLFRKAETSESRLKVHRINLVSLSKEVFLCFTHQARKKNIDYVFEGEEGEIEAYVDREKMETVLFNLLSNAMKFTPEGGRIIFSIHAKSEKIFISVADTGCGVAEDIGDKLFSRFYQESTSNTANGGFGIGLFLVRNFVEAHGGSITYQSRLNEGTTFTIELLTGTQHLKNAVIYHDDDATSSLILQELIDDEVAVNAMAAQADKPFIETEITTESSDVKTILIVDDNGDFREYVKQIFAVEYKVFEADNGAGGLKLVKEVLPDIVISDVMMQGMSGIELCASIREDLAISHIPVILLTSSTSSEIKLKGLENGADDYISKPFDKEILQARVAGILKSKNTLQRYFYNEITLNSNTQKVSKEYKTFLDNCIRIVEKHLTNPDFNIQVLASELGMSYSSLYKKIKFISGQSTNGFIRFIRLRKAAEIFIHTDKNILETSYMVGINDIKYFREQFKKVFKINPSEYIKKYRRAFSDTEKL